MFVLLYSKAMRGRVLVLSAALQHSLAHLWDGMWLALHGLRGPVLDKEGHNVGMGLDQGNAAVCLAVLDDLDAGGRVHVVQRDEVAVLGK